MQVGDLVRINQSIPEYTAVTGSAIGVLIAMYEPATYPALFDVLWSSGQTEKLYSDELEVVSASR